MNSDIETKAIERQSRPTLLHPSVVAFANDLYRLGADGFSSWLMEAFGGAVPRFPLYAFSHNEDMGFTDLFAEIHLDLPRDAIDIARVGVAKAASMFASIPKPSPSGALALARLSEDLRLYHRVREITRVVENISVSKDDIRSKLIFLREILESLLRLFVGIIFELSRAGSTVPLDLELPESPTHSFEPLCRF